MDGDRNLVNLNNTGPPRLGCTTTQMDDVLNDVVANDRLAMGASSSMLPTRSDPDLGECVARLARLKAKIEVRERNRGRGMCC